MSSPTIDQETTLIEEVDVAISFIDEGLISLKRLEIDDFVHLPILLLSNGFERLLKMIICLGYRERNGRFPNTKDFKIKTHDIEDFLERVITIAKGRSYEKRCAEAEKDMDFLENDTELQRIVKLLTEYGISSRYYNINIIVGEENRYGKPVELFESYCRDLEQLGWEKKVTGESLVPVRQHITRLLQQFGRALCRMFIWGELGQTGKEIGESNIVRDLLCLRDEDLGKVKPRWFQS